MMIYDNDNNTNNDNDNDNDKTITTTIMSVSYNAIIGICKQNIVIRKLLSLSNPPDKRIKGSYLLDSIVSDSKVLIFK